MRSVSKVTACVLVVCACGGSTGLATDVDVVISSNRASVSLTAPVQIVVTVTNRSNAPTEIITSGCVPTFEVVDANGIAVGPWSGPCAPVAPPPELLDPHASRNFVSSWNATAAGPAVSPQSLAPGTYRVRAKMAIAGSVRYSAPIVIEVRP